MPINPTRTVSAPGLPAGRQAITPIQFVRISTAGKDDHTFGIRYSDGRVLAIDDRPEEGCFLLSLDDCRRRGCRFEAIPPNRSSGNPRISAISIEFEGVCYPAILFGDRVSFLGPQGKRCIGAGFAINEGAKLSNRMLPGCAWG